MLKVWGKMLPVSTCFSIISKESYVTRSIKIKLKLNMQFHILGFVLDVQIIGHWLNALWHNIYIKVHLVKAMGFSSSHVLMWELDYKESWEPKNWCFWTVMLEKTLGSPLNYREIQPIHPKGDWSWVFIGRTDVEAEAPILGPPDAKSWLIWKARDAGKDWGQEEKGATEDEMAGWHHRLNGHEFG